LFLEKKITRKKSNLLLMFSLSNNLVVEKLKVLTIIRGPWHLKWAIERCPESEMTSKGETATPYNQVHEPLLKKKTDS
jgi:hypothetical protein